jgi:two-component system OmpR family sensor kinase/two-component system sensor histidine kinase BaeS
MSLRLRITLSFALIVLVSVTSVVLLARQGAASEVRSFMFRGGLVSLDDLVLELEAFYRAHGSWEGVQSLLIRSVGQGASGRGSGMGSGSGGGGQRLRLVDESGNLVADSRSQPASGAVSSEELSQGLPIRVDGRVVGYLLSETGMGYTSNDESFLIKRLNQAALTAALIAGGLSLLLALLVAYRLLHPIQLLTQAVQKLGQGDLSQRVKVSGSDEVALLGRTFNRMADSLQLTQQNRRAMTADIAHELRNPLAVQRANLEALQDGVYPMTAEALQPVLEQNILLSHLVDDLRTLALADAGQLELQRNLADMSALIRRIVDRFQSQAAAQDVQLTILPDQGPAKLVWLDAMRVEQILNNLLSNALRHTPAGGQIELQLEYPAQGVLLHVTDSGPGIPEQALGHIFERFYRADRSRSRAEGGVGLGLAIARKLAEAHGGTLSAANRSGEGLLGARFTLSLPYESQDEVYEAQ